MGLNNGQTIDQTDFVSSSSGAPDSGKVNKLNAAGKNPVAFNEFVGVKAIQNALTNPGTSSFITTPFQTEEFDTDSFHNNSVNNSRLTVPAGKAGTYVVGGSYYSTTSARAASIQLRKNGTIILAACNGAGSISNNNAVSATTIVQLSVGDYIELFAAVASGDNSSGNLSTNLWMYQLSI